MPWTSTGRDGKVLDLGLAKLVRAGPEEILTTTETVSALTEGGAVMGTVGYVSPEHAQGKPLVVGAPVCPGF